MIDSHIEARPDIPARLKHIIHMGELTRHTVPVNSVNGLGTETYQYGSHAEGLSTMGLNTCSAIAGYYLKDAKLQLFLAHIQPEILPEKVLGRLDLAGVEGVTFDCINGTATTPERNKKFAEAVEQYFHERHINIHAIPDVQKKVVKAPYTEKVFSYGALLGMEMKNETTSMPVLTVFEEI